MLLLAGVGETGLLPVLERAVQTTAPRDEARLAQATPPTRRMLLLTLLFLGAVGLRRTWDLRGYTGAALALLTGRHRAYGYRAVERFLSDLAAADGAAALTNALAAWATALWHPEPQPTGDALPSCYIDGHRKAVFSAALIPRGLVARRGVVLGCRALVLLHDAAGHPLLATTQRGDVHLTLGAPALLARYERHSQRVSGFIIDREGMAAAFLRQLAAAGRQVVTVLRSDQYTGLSSFAEVGAFVPLQRDRRGVLVREVAPARCSLALPDHPEERLDLRVALVRDLRRQVPCPPTEVEAHARARRTSDEDEALDEWGVDEPYDLDDAWAATPAPAAPTMTKLIPVVTTAADADPVALARAYFHRWPAQENVIKDWLLPLGLDTNHGYAKTAVVNSEVAKRRTTLKQRLDRVKRWAEGALARSRQAGRSYGRLWDQAKKRSDALYRALNARQTELRVQGVDEYARAAEIKGMKRRADAELDERWARAQRAWGRNYDEYQKYARYCRQQRALLRQLEDLATSERTMYELDNAKDQVMTVCKVALANVAMCVRDRYFPAGYAHATWARLLPFFRLPGCIAWGPDTVRVTLRPFNDRQLTRDLALLCERVRALQPRLPDGRRLIFSLTDAERPILDVQEEAVA